MSEKIYEFPLNHALTVAKRKLLINYVESNADRLPWKIAYEWEEETKTLHVKTNVVRWELIFYPKKLEVYGNGPFWAKMMFTDKIREKLYRGIIMVLQEVGLQDPPASQKKSKKSAATRKRLIQ